jgi:hypothetical protein
LELAKIADIGEDRRQTSRHYAEPLRQRGPITIGLATRSPYAALRI